ncbi:hypothetical protein [Cohnella abietis]|uniref:DUF4830 domain-containing protein n=1 Tax=Cohnella abietis TaxID=2507935 RepID=A0A3T1D6E9_9BACL|nr:hypothetical protein [Cohnella abietis]BBI33652.1 hypothetical protein KCTCHS21_30510 [Cohnella abietis]
MRKRLLCIILLLVVTILSGCRATENQELTENAEIAKLYIEKEGYIVLSYESNVSTYVLTKDMVKTLPYSMYWTLPGNDPKPAYGKTVSVEKFIVKNHPLDNYKSGNAKSKGKTEVYVHLANGEVVAGTSFPVMNEQLSGGYWNINGKTN